MEFTPPIHERHTLDLLRISCSIDGDWQMEAIKQANEELLKRGITESNKREFIRELEREKNRQKQLEKERLLKNEDESYSVVEMILLFLFGPILVLKFHGIKFNNTVWFLKKENYKLKLKQRIIILLLSFIGYYLIIMYEAKTKEKELIEKINKLNESKKINSHL
jgi:hypothetical protein